MWRKTIDEVRCFAAQEVRNVLICRLVVMNLDVDES